MKKILSIGTTVAVLLGALTACTSTDADTIDSVTLAVGDQIAGTEKVLQASGELDSIPYGISWSTFTSGPPQIEALNAGQIDFAITGNTPPVLGGLTDTKVIQAYSNTAEGDAILSPAGSDISTIAGLKGKSIAVARGSSAHGHLILQLEKAGLSPDDVEINFLQPSDSKSAFESGQVDAWAVWDPYTAIAEVGGAIPLATATGVANGFGFGIASDNALEDDLRSEALRDLGARVARAYQWAADNPEEWARIYAEETGTDPAAARLHARSTRVSIPLDDAVVDSQNELIDAFHQAGLLPTPFNFADQIDHRFSTTEETAS